LPQVWGVVSTGERPIGCSNFALFLPAQERPEAAISGIFSCSGQQLLTLPGRHRWRAGTGTADCRTYPEG